MDKRVPLSEPVMAGNEWKYVKECIDTAWVSSAGRFVDEFSEKFAEYLEMPYAVPVVNGTAALHISLMALGLKPDEEVLVPTLTFIATANVVVYCHAHPVFMDVEEDTLGVDPQKVEDFLARECDWKRDCLVNKSTGRKVRGIIPVHLYGHPVDMSSILELADRYNLFVLEDATEALGSEYKGGKAGTFGHAAAFSFNGNKLITSGGGGMVTTNDSELADRIRSLSTQARSPGMEYYHTEVGYNYRLANLQAALGLAQLERVDEFIKMKRHIAAFYQRELGNGIGLRICREKDWAFSNYWLSWALIQDEFGMRRREILDRLNAQGIQARPFFIPLHLLPPYKDYQAYRIELAEGLYERGMNIPSHVGLTDDDLHLVVAVIKELSTRY